MRYQKYVYDKAAQIHKEMPDLPEEWLPTPVFQPRILPIRKAKGHDPIHRTVLWQSTVDSGDVDVLYLIEYLCSQGRDCHVNSGVHGKVNANGEFEFVWDEASKDFKHQDYKSAVPTKNNVSLHEITENPFAGPIYHAGIDTIDGFCKS